ncbi:sulfur relay (sulfurtransferase) complex TusBCD TusD component (DsrE family) [Roseovarius sp. MBR-154]
MWIPSGRSDREIPVLLHDPPYGTERSCNGRRMAHALAKHDADAEMMEGTTRSTMDDLTEATTAADKVLVF